MEALTPTAPMWPHPRKLLGASIQHRPLCCAEHTNGKTAATPLACSSARLEQREYNCEKNYHLANMCIPACDSGVECLQNVAAGNKIFHVTDQLALNLLFDQAVRPDAGRFFAAPENDKVILVKAGNITTSFSAPISTLPESHIRIHPLPVLSFANGHVAFIQRLPSQ